MNMPEFTAAWSLKQASALYHNTAPCCRASVMVAPQARPGPESCWYYCAVAYPGDYWNCMEACYAYYR